MEYTTRRRRDIYSGRVIRLVVDKLQFADGSEWTCELVVHPGAVAIVPVLPDGRV